MAGSGKGVRAYRVGVGIAALAALLTVWTTIVRDDGSGGGFLMLVLAAVVGGYAALFEASGMARAMTGVAGMQVMLGILVATAPVTASHPGLPLKVLLFNGAFALLWLMSAAFFRSAAKSD